MSMEDARLCLRRFGLEERIQEFSVSSATVELAAQALQIEPARIAKSLAFQWEESGLLLIAAGDARIDNRAFREAFGCKAHMLSPEDTLRLTGHPVGGVCPFGLAQPLPVYLDVSLQRFDTVYPAAGTSNSAVRLSCEELFAAASAKAWVDVCKGWRSEEA